MQRRLISLILAIFLLLSLAPAASAAPGVYFTMINTDAPETLDSRTMPLNRNGTMYVPLTTLGRLGIVATHGDNSVRLSLSRDAGVFVHFDLAEGSNVTQRGDSLAVAPLSRFGTFFFPVGGTTTGPLMAHFGANYRLLSTDPAPIVRLYNESLGLLTHNALLNNADTAYGLTARLEAFLGHQQTGETGSATVSLPPTPPGNGDNDNGDGDGNNGNEPNGPEEPGSETPQTQPAPPINVSVSFVGLGADTEDLLDTLYRAGIPAGFFVTAEDIKGHPDLVRRLHGEGHLLGIHLREYAEEEFIAASEALFAAARLRTVLVVAEDEAVAREADDLGVIVYGADIIREFNGGAALESISGDLLLDSDTANPYALTALASLLRSSGYRVSRVIHSIFTP